MCALEEFFGRVIIGAGFEGAGGVDVEFHCRGVGALGGGIGEGGQHLGHAGEKQLPRAAVDFGDALWAGAQAADVFDGEAAGLRGGGIVDGLGGGGQQFESQQDPAWLTLRDFVMGAKAG